MDTLNRIAEYLSSQADDIEVTANKCLDELNKIKTEFKTLTIRLNKAQAKYSLDCIMYGDESPTAKISEFILRGLSVEAPSCAVRMKLKEIELQDIIKLLVAKRVDAEWVDR